MSTVIETGKTVEEALEKALVALGRSVDEVDYEVIEQPSRGFSACSAAVWRACA